MLYTDTNAHKQISTILYQIYRYTILGLGYAMPNYRLIRITIAQHRYNTVNCLCSNEQRSIKIYSQSVSQILT